MMTVRYNCKKCMAIDSWGEVAIKHRRHNEEIKEILDRVGRAVAEHHAAHHPLCTSKKADIMLPIGANGVVGAPYP